MSPNKNYISGRAFEYKRKKHWETQGYLTMRTAGSHGAFDILAFHSERPCLLIQCKRVEKASEATRLLKQFQQTPPLTPSRYFHQVMEVYVKETKELLNVTV